MERPSARHESGNSRRSQLEGSCTRADVRSIKRDRGAAAAGPDGGSSGSLHLDSPAGGSRLVADAPAPEGHPSLKRTLIPRLPLPNGSGAGREAILRSGANR